MHAWLRVWVVDFKEEPILFYLPKYFRKGKGRIERKR
jgi:hypothetical protein